MKKVVLILVSYLALAAGVYFYVSHRSAETGHSDGQKNGSEAAERPGLVFTHFTDRSELFVEFDALVVGMESAFAAHFNDVTRFKPLASGKVVVTLSGGGAPDEQYSVDGPSVPGIFRPVAVPKHPGKRKLVVQHIDGQVNDTHDLGEMTVFASQKEAIEAARAEEESPGAIIYLKEQAWKTDFATAPVEPKEMRQSVAAPATIKARPDGDAEIIAPSQGKVAASGTFPHVGRRVNKGELLAFFSPLSGEAVDVTQLELDATRAALAFEAATREYERTVGLIEQAAVPERRLHEAKATLTSAQAGLQAARARLEQARNSSGGTGGRIHLRSPIDGVIAEVQAAPGTLVQQGAPLIRVVNPSVLWLEVNVPEADLGKAVGANEAWFEVEGMEQVFAVGSKNPGKLLASGAVVDSKTRTTVFLFEFPNPKGLLKVGMFAQARLLTGKPEQAVAVPASAVVDDNGQDVVYVQLEGESFQRRPVTLGAREGEWISLVEGVQAGERVVSIGAYNLKLASSAGSVPAHGHAH